MQTRLMLKVQSTFLTTNFDITNYTIHRIFYMVQIFT
jgi:hypothetical protein